MLSLSFYGGSSKVSEDGLEEVNAIIDDKEKIQFLFYPHESPYEKTKQGVVNRIYFKLPF